MGQVIAPAPSKWEKLKGAVSNPINSLGAVYQKYKNDLENKASFKKDPWTAIRNNFVLPAEASELSADEIKQQSGGPWKTPGYQAVPQKPKDINSNSGGSGSGSGSNSKLIKAIGRGWEDAGDVLGDTRKSLDSSKNYISNLGKVRDKYISSLDNYKKRTEDAVAGNKTLIEKNQKKDLDSLAGDTRKSMDNTNVMLGVKGASGGSASKQAARAIAQSAGKSRAGVLTAYGDENSKQNQSLQNAIEEYNTKRAQSYEWEKTARKEAEDEFKEKEAALKRLKSKASKWEQADIEAESDKNLNSFMGSLGQIMMEAKTFRDNLANKYSEYGGLADELDVASVNIDAPAELETPEFNENIDLNDPNNAEDWYNPDKTGKRIIKDYDALGNPIYEDEVVGTESAV